jgi:hypothetical protein
VVPPPPNAHDSQTNALVLHEVKPPVPILNLGLYSIAATALALLIAALLWWLLHHRRRRRRRPPQLVIIPPHRRAHDRLRAALHLIHQPKPFCTDVADALRLYLEERFDLNAPERTTEEFLTELHSSPHLIPKQKDILADFLTRCDLVKFARHEPAESELRALWETALQLVTETAPTP